MTNETRETTLRAVDAEQLRVHAITRQDLDAWDDQILALNFALTDAALVRDRLADISRRMDLDEAGPVLNTVGGNAETPKAIIILYLNEACPAYQTLLGEQRVALLKLADAERWACVRRKGVHQASLAWSVLHQRRLARIR